MTHVAHLREADRRTLIAQAGVAQAVGRWLEFLEPDANRGIDEHDVLCRPVYEPVAFARAARAVADHATRMAADALVQARVEGRSWEQLASALGIEGTTAEETIELIYELAAGHRAGDDCGLWWTCGSCRAAVTDQPWRSHPDEAECGHTSGCPRRLELLDRWTATQEATSPMTTQTMADHHTQTGCSAHHTPQGKPRWRAGCSCGWVSHDMKTLARATRAWEQHVLEEWN